MEDFIHLHVHTYYSILDGQSPVEKLVDKPWLTACAAWLSPTMAICSA